MDLDQFIHETYDSFTSVVRYAVHNSKKLDLKEIIEITKKNSQDLWLTHFYNGKTFEYGQSLEIELNTGLIAELDNEQLSLRIINGIGVGKFQCEEITALYDDLANRLLEKQESERNKYINQIVNVIRNIN